MKYLSYIIAFLSGGLIGYFTFHALNFKQDCKPVIIHTDNYRVKYETSFDLIRKQYIKIDSLKKLPKSKFIIVYEKTNDSIRTDNIPRSFLELSEYLCR